MQETYKNVCRQTYSYLEVSLRRLLRKTYDDNYDIRDKNQHTCKQFWSNNRAQSQNIECK